MEKNDRYRRKKFGTKEQNNIILVVCGGETEKIYFDQFKLDLGEIKVKVKTKPNSPRQIVQYAMAEKQKINYRQVWCVFDKDDNTDYDDAIILALKQGIRPIYSNQAFEFWYILHFEKKNGHLDRREYDRTLESYLKREYNKTDDTLFSFLRPYMKTAISNAKWGHQIHKLRGGNPSTWESCTSVYELVEELLRWKK